MKINIKATNLVLSPELENYLKGRLEQLDKLVTGGPDTEAMVQAELARDTMHHKQGEIFRAEFNLRLNGRQFRAVCTEPDIYAAIDLAKDELTREVKSDKQKRVTLLRRGARQVKNFLKGFYK